MKKNLLFIVTSMFLGILITACASKKDMFSVSSFQSATAPATTRPINNPSVLAVEELTIAEPAEEPVTVSEASAPSKEITTITEEDIAKFERELSALMGSDYRPASSTTQGQQNVVLGNSNAKFYVITGSFNSAEKAQAHREELKADGNDSGIIAGDMGMFRVYAFAGNNRAVALKELSLIRDFYPEAWLFVKK